MHACNYTLPTIVSAFKPFFLRKCIEFGAMEIRCVRLPLPSCIIWRGVQDLCPVVLAVCDAVDLPLIPCMLVHFLQAILLDCQFDVVDNSMPLSCATAKLQQPWNNT